MVSDHLHSISQMVRTRETTVPTPPPARQEAPEPATEIVGRRGAVARGRGRGRGRTSSRGRGQAPGPSGTRAVTPPPIEEVVRKGEKGENEELPPQPTPEMINQVLAYLSRLSDQGRLQCFLHQHLRFLRYNMQLLWLPALIPHWK